jgi:hypothetical protein
MEVDIERRAEPMPKRHRTKTCIRLRTWAACLEYPLHRCHENRVFMKGGEPTAHAVLHEKVIRKSCSQPTQRARAKPCAKIPHSHMPKQHLALVLRHDHYYDTYIPILQGLDFATLS